MERTYRVPAMTCGHCRSAIESEVGKVGGVHRVVVDLEAKTVAVDGGEDPDIRAAIDEAGFEVAGVL